MAITTTSISNRPLITPNELLRQLQTARQRGGMNDYYGIGAALRGVGNDYEQMQRDQDQMRGFNAKADSGYYPAQAASEVSQYNLNTYNNTDKLQTQQDIKQAFQAARAQGLTPGTFPFEQFMQQHMTTLGGVQSRTPEMLAARKDMMNQRLYVASIKQATQALVANQLADGYKKDNLDARMAEGQARGENPMVTMQRVNEDAKAWGQQHMQDQDLQFSLDPTTYQITMKGKDPKTGEYKDKELDPTILAAAAKGLGMPAWDNLFTNLAIRRFMAENPGKYTVDSNGKITATTGATGAAGTKGKTPPTDLETEIEHYNKLHAAYLNAIATKSDTFNQEDRAEYKDELQKSRDKIESLRKQQAGGIATPDTSDAAAAMYGRPGGPPVLMPQDTPVNGFAVPMQGQGGVPQVQPTGTPNDIPSISPELYGMNQSMATPADYQIGIPPAPVQNNSWLDALSNYYGPNTILGNRVQSTDQNPDPYTQAIR